MKCRYLAALLSAIAAVAVPLLAPAARAAATLSSTPAIPQYGQALSVAIVDTPWPVYLPATGYTISGSTITLDYDYSPDSFGPWGPDYGYASVALGELPPGNYTAVARFHDPSDPGAVAQTLTVNIPVVPPQDPGVYAVPKAPRANDVVQVVVRSAAYFDPATLEASLSGNVIRVDFDYRATAPVGGAVPPGMTSFASVKVGRLAPGSYQVEGWGRPDTGGDYQRYFTASFLVDGESNVIEYYQPQLGHYFISAGGDEIGLLDAGGQGGWKRTGQSFHAWARAQDAPPGAQPVCRFYAAGPNSHFYTGDADECAQLKSLEQAQRAEAAAAGTRFFGWGYEGIAFWALMPVDGQCPAGTDPVWRAYNNRAAENDSNHRFTVDPLQRVAMAIHWIDEGVAFCSPH